MRVTLVRPPFYSIADNSDGSHPLGVGYLDAALTEAGHDVTFVDGEAYGQQKESRAEKGIGRIVRTLWHTAYARQNWRRYQEIMEDKEHPLWSTVAQKIADTDPEVVAISCYTVNMTAVQRIVDQIVHLTPGVKIVLGGVHPTSLPEQTLIDLPEVTAVVIGEGEVTFPKLCAEWEKENPDLDQVAGIAYRDPRRGVVQTAPRPLIANLDQIPPPTRSWPGHSYYTHRAMTSRGCPYTCSFCDSQSIWTRKVRYHSIERILDDIGDLHNLGVTDLRYADDTFTLDHGRMEQWIDGVQGRGYHRSIRFSIGTRVELVSEEMVKKYRDAGVAEISFGVESGSPRVQKLISKDFKTIDPVERIKIVSQAGMTARVYFMIGHPTETKEDVNLTLKMIEALVELPNTYVVVNVTCPYPGAGLWESALQVTGGEEFIGIDSYYTMYHQTFPVVNMTAINDADLARSIKQLTNVSNKSVTRSKLKQLTARLSAHPVKTLAHIAKRAAGR